MVGAAAGYLREQLRRRSERIPVGITWSFVIVTDLIVLVGGAVATLQRPAADLPAALAALAIAVAPLLLFFVFNMKFSPVLLWASWSATTAVMLFATSTPVPADFAPGPAGADGRNRRHSDLWRRRLPGVSLGDRVAHRRIGAAPPRCWRVVRRLRCGGLADRVPDEHPTQTAGATNPGAGGAGRARGGR